MDRDVLFELAELVGKILETEPSDEDLDYNEDAIEVYASIHNLKEALKNIGIGDF